MPTDNPTLAELVKRAWPLGGFAPGDYLCKCQTCGQQFQGDKRAFQCLNCAAETVRHFLKSQASRIEELEAENKRLREALTPSGDTKADYMGEFSFGITLSAGGEEDYRRIMVPWTTIKEIMAAIRARAALESVRDGV